MSLALVFARGRPGQRSSDQSPRGPVAGLVVDEITRAGAVLAAQVTEAASAVLHLFAEQRLPRNPRRRPSSPKACSSAPRWSPSAAPPCSRSSPMARRLRHNRDFPRAAPGRGTPCDTRMEQASLGLNHLSSAPRSHPRRTSGWGQVHEHRPRATPSPSANLHQLAHSPRATSRRTRTIEYAHCISNERSCRPQLGRIRRCPRICSEDVT
jgi:hypothetical protein